MTCVTFEGQFCTFPPKNSPHGGSEIFIMVYNDIQVSMNEKQLNKFFRQHPVKFCGHLKMRDVCDAHRTWLSRCWYICGISCEWGFFAKIKSWLLVSVKGVSILVVKPEWWFKVNFLQFNFLLRDVCDIKTWRVWRPSDFIVLRAWIYYKFTWNFFKDQYWYWNKCLTNPLTLILT